MASSNQRQSAMEAITAPNPLSNGTKTEAAWNIQPGPLSLRLTLQHEKVNSSQRIADSNGRSATLHSPH